jgi:hypothetical protein
MQRLENSVAGVSCGTPELKESQVLELVEDENREHEERMGQMQLVQKRIARLKLWLLDPNCVSRALSQPDFLASLDELYKIATVIDSVDRDKLLWDIMVLKASSSKKAKEKAKERDSKFDVGCV